MQFKTIILTFLALFFFSCATIQYPEALTGSKADGIITVGYEYPAAYNPNNWEEEWKKADESANRRCNAWGYSKAVKFDNAFGPCLRSQNSKI